MRSHRSDLNTKEKVLEDVEECITSVVKRGICDVDRAAPLVDSIDRVLRYGLKDPDNGYWHFIHGYTHAPVQVLNNCFSPARWQQQPQQEETPKDKDVTWLCCTLVEGRLIGCLSSLILDERALRRHYTDAALLRHKPLAVQFLCSLHQLRMVILLLPRMASSHEIRRPEENRQDPSSSVATGSGPGLKGSAAGTVSSGAAGGQDSDSVGSKVKQEALGLSEGDGAGCKEKQPPSDDLGFSVLMTSSVLSLASPVDSGVSLVEESDVDNTSMSDVVLENEKNEDDLRTFASMEDSGIIWGESTTSLELDSSVAGSVTTKIYNDNMSAMNNNNNNTDNNVSQGDGGGDSGKCDSKVIKTTTDMDTVMVGRGKIVASEVVDAAMKKTYSEDDKDVVKTLESDSKEGVEQRDKDDKYGGCGDEIVYRRTRGRKTKKEKAKRVSFHEADADGKTLSEGGRNCRGVGVAAGDGTPIRRHCYSWCSENLAPFHIERDDGHLDTDRGGSLKTGAGETGENESSTTLSDSEVGVEVDCDSSSSTLEEVTPRSVRPGSLYKRWATTVKQFGLNRSDLDLHRHRSSEPEIFYGSTTSLSSCNNANDDQRRKSDPHSHQQHHNQHQDYRNSEPSRKLQHKLGMGQKRQSISRMLKSIKGGQWLIPVSERGVPEGQEDPQQQRGACTFSSNLNSEKQRLMMASRSGSTLEWSSDSEWSEFDDSISRRKPNRNYMHGRRSARRCLWPLRMLQEAPSKTSLVNRFLQSIPETKAAPTVNLALARQRLPLYIKGVKADAELSRQLLEELEEEMKSHVPPEERSYSVLLDDNLASTIKKYTLETPDEKIYKVYQVTSLEGLPLLCVLSDKAVYLTGVSPVNHGFCNHYVVQYSQLNYIIVGPNRQVMMVVAMDRSQKVTMLATLGPRMAGDLLSHLELAVRRAFGRSHLDVQQLRLQEMTTLRHTVLKQSPVQEDEELEHYVWVNIGDASVIPASTPLGPTKSGHLMFRPHRHSPWLPGYVLLKAGVLYVFADANQRLPNHAVPLHSGQCGGCRRVPSPSRPHTFEVLLLPTGSGSMPTFQLAAADDYEVSDWLQAFVQAASEDSGAEVLHDELAEAVTGCGLLLTTRHILTLAFPYKVLSCARTEDLASIRLAYNCCVLETGCREISEGGGDWVVYFATDTALEEFLEHMVRLRPALADSVVMMSESDPLTARCEQTSRLLEECWDLLLHPQATTI